MLVSFTILLSLLCLPLSETMANNSKKQNTHDLKLTFNDKVIYHSKVNEGKYIQVLNGEKEIIESVLLKNDLEMELVQPTIPEGYIFSYWNTQDDNTHFKINPVFIEEKDVTIQFIAQNGGNLVHNNSQLKELTNTYKQNTLLKDVLPEINPNENYKFKGWFIAENDKELEKLNVTDTLKINDTKNYLAQFYQDINNNNLDDTTEKITLSFATNNGQQINDIHLHVGQPFTLPKLNAKPNYVFIGWYLDTSYKTKYSSEDNLTTNTTLYAKWEEANEVINKPITDENISEQVESLLNGRLDRLEAAIQNTGENTNSTSTNPSIQPSNVPASNNNILPQSETVTTPTTATTPQNQSSNEVLTYTEPKYLFTNSNVGESYMVRFYDETENFLFSLVLPYGRTIKLLDQSENLVKEYTVRQSTIIKLNTNDYIFGEELLEFDSRTIKENSSDITEVFPVLKIAKVQESTLSKSTTAEESDSNSNVFIALGILLVLFITAVIFYLIKRNNKINKNIESTQIK